jgi:D-arabinose 1-dehydrogenase-like Zn-dependent alcohol dehydrogenase
VPLDPSALVWGNKRIVGVVMYDPWVIPKALDFVQRTRDKYPLGKVVSHKFPLEKINDAFAQAEWLNRQTDVAITRAALTMG